MVKIVKIKTEHVSQMRTLFEVLKEILSYTTIEFIRPSDDTYEPTDKVKKSKKSKKGVDTDSAQNNSFSGMRILTLSPEKTVLIYLRLHARKFMEFVCKPNKHEIGVDLGALNRMLKSTDREDELEMYIDNDDKQSLVLSVSNSEIGRNTEFKLKLMETDPFNFKLPPVEADVMITMNAGEFHKLCKDMAQIGQALEIKCTKNVIIFTCNGINSSRETKYTVNDDGVKIVFAELDKAESIVQGVYELKHLNLFSKCASLSTDVQLMMRVKKYPVCLTYTVATLGEFVACVSPMEQDSELQQKSATQMAFTDAEALYQSDNDVGLKDEFKNITC